LTELPPTPATLTETPIPWGLRDVLWGLLLAFGLVVAVLALLFGLSRGLHLTPAVLRARHLAAAFLALGEAVLLVPVWVLARRRRGATWRQLGVCSFRPLIGCLGAIALFFLALWINMIWGLVLQALHWSGQPVVTPLFGQGPIGIILAFLGISAIAPLSEELFFRGFAFPPLRRHFGLWLGAALNGLLFGLLHFTPTVLPPLFFLGFAFCLLYEYSGSIWPGVILHASINTLSLLSAFIVMRNP